jgi:hypothetical protein
MLGQSAKLSARRLVSLSHPLPRHVCAPIAACQLITWPHSSCSSSVAPFTTRSSASSVRSSSPRSLSTRTKPSGLEPIPDYPFTTLWELIEGAARLFPTNRIFGFKTGDSFEFISYAEFLELVSVTRTMLQSEFQIGAGDKVAIVSNNRVEWATLMYAATSLGAEFVPMYEAQLEKDWLHIVQDSEAKLIICANRKIREKCQHYVGTVGNVQALLSLDKLTEECDQVSGAILCHSNFLSLTQTN